MTNAAGSLLWETVYSTSWMAFKFEEKGGRQQCNRCTKVAHDKDGW